MQTTLKPKVYLLLLFTFFYVTTGAQTAVLSPVGEYYLSGVMETGSGFKVNRDSSFQFFFSYGALDRYGAGSWAIKNNRIVFSSRKRPQHDFALVVSSAGSRDAIAIQFIEANELMLRYVHCKITGGGKEQEGQTDEKGIVYFEVQPVETIELIFEFCPEKKSVFKVAETAHHAFQFRPEPWLMEVFFQDFSLALTADGLAGGHPLLNGTSFRYEKTAE